MGKIVKYCAACDESFAEKFGFCPNCGQEMTAFEMNPLNNAQATAAEAPKETVENHPVIDTESDDILDIPMIAAPVMAAPVPVIETPSAVEAKTSDVIAPEPTVYYNENQTEAFADESPAETVPVVDAAPETKTFAAGAGAGTTVGNFSVPNKTQFYNYPISDSAQNDGFHVTVIEDKGVKQRNLLLLGSLLLMTSLALGGVIYNLFNHNLYVGSIDEDNPLYVSVVDDVPMEIEKQPKKEKDDGGGGGGGGDKNQQDASKGRLANQVDKPIMPPKPMDQVTNPSLPNPQETQGKIKRDRTTEPVGMLNGVQSDNLSSGRGSGGGIGNGNGTGIGNGNGTGEGNGNGSGSGNGNGNGNGDGNGNGGTRPPPPPPVPPVGVTETVKIISKPRANYTDAARQNQVQGTVTLRVTFLPSGQIGGIAPVSGLPYGLTEQAIAAARGIRFEPAKKNGVPYPVTKQVQYSFTIY